MLWASAPQAAAGLARVESTTRVASHLGNFEQPRQLLSMCPPETP